MNETETQCCWTLVKFVFRTYKTQNSRLCNTGTKQTVVQMKHDGDIPQMLNLVERLVSSYTFRNGIKTCRS